MKKKIITIVLAAVLIAVAVAGVIVVSSGNDYETVMAQLYTANQRLDVEGVLLCEQIPVSIPQDGAVQYVLEDGERVARGGEIARIYQSEAAVSAARRIRELENEKEDLLTVQQQIEGEALSPESLSGQLDALYVQISQTAAEDPEALPELRRKLTRLLNYKNTGTTEAETAAYAQRIAEIDAEIRTQRGKVGNYRSVTASSAGYFYSNGAGHVGVSAGNVSRLSCSDVDRLIREGQTAAQQSGPMLVTGYTFNFAFNISSIQAALLPSEKLQMVFPGSGDKIVTAEIVASNKEGGENSRTAVVVSALSGTENILDNGVFGAQIHLARRTGLRIPLRAVRTAEVNGEEVPGVYVMVGPVMEFRRINVLMNDGDYAVCENTGKSGWLELYDNVIVSGKRLADDKVL